MAEAGPLAGVTVLVTRAKEQAPALGDPLSALGADVVITPAIRFADPSDWKPLDRALERAGSYAWAIFTSGNGVEAVARRLASLGLTWTVFDGVRLAAIGPATAAALEEKGMTVTVVPEIFQAEGILDALGGEPLEGARILLARAEKAREILPEELRRRGAVVDVAPAYRTVPSPPTPPAVEALDRAGREPVIVTFTSSSTVTGFVGGLEERSRTRLSDAVIAAIGPITSEELGRLGLRPAIQPDAYTIPALVEAIRTYFVRRGSESSR